MIMEANGSGLPKEALEDCFKPPDEPCQVRCLHCGQEYCSSRIVWRQAGERGFWCCPIEDCDGAGFMFDIFPADGTGWTDDEEDEDEGEDEDDWDEDWDEDLEADTDIEAWDPSTDATGEADPDPEIPF